jgi:hypothetical protein
MRIGSRCEPVSNVQSLDVRSAGAAADLTSWRVDMRPRVHSSSRQGCRDNRPQPICGHASRSSKAQAILATAQRRLKPAQAVEVNTGVRGDRHISLQRAWVYMVKSALLRLLDCKFAGKFALVTSCCLWCMVEQGGLGYVVSIYEDWRRTCPCSML